MIELIVEDYCQECPEFKPDINRTIQRSWDDKTMVLSTTVFCEYAYRCREMEKHFRRNEEVVQCRDCKYGEVDNADFPDQYFCNHHGCDWNEGNHYCSYGERQEP